jgi:hypothetical protein
MMMVSQATCTATCKDNRPCRAPALADGLCFVHSPLTAEARDRTRRENGKARMRRRAVLPEAADVVLGAAQDVLRLLAETASQVRRGELDSRVGNCLCCIAATALRAVECIDMARLREEMREEMRRQAEALRREMAEEDPELREVLDDV